MSALHNDGTVQYASRVLSINSVNYVADNITVNRPVKRILRTNELGEPSGSVGVADFVTGSATLQLASGSTAEPQSGSTYTFTVTFDTAIGAETFYVSGVDRSENKDAEKKINIQFIKKYN